MNHLLVSEINVIHSKQKTKNKDESPDEVIESFVGIRSKIECVLYR
jgi:hypothetical protein